MPMFHHHFAHVPDPRVCARSDHKLLDLLAISILAVICGADGWEELATFGRCKEKWLRTFLDLPAGIPSTAMKMASDESATSELEPEPSEQ